MHEKAGIVEKGGGGGQKILQWRRNGIARREGEIITRQGLVVKIEEEGSDIQIFNIYEI